MHGAALRGALQSHRVVHACAEAGAILVKAGASTIGGQCVEFGLDAYGRPVGSQAFAFRRGYSISSVSSEPGTGRSPITGSRPPRRIELPSYSVRWSMAGGSVQSVSFICPLCP